MADIDQASNNTANNMTTTAGHPTEQMEIEENSPAQPDIVYPTGSKFYALMGALAISAITGGLDITIFATALPAITNDFKTVQDIGWYGSVYRLTTCSFLFMFGKMYSVFSVKLTYIASLLIFEIGSLVCTIAPTSSVFILGRAISGVGTSGFLAGIFVIMVQAVPLRHRPLVGGLAGGIEAVACLCGPLLGGILTDRLSWRACFGINIPLGVAGAIIIAFTFQNPKTNPDTKLPLKEKLERLDLLSTAMIVPAIVCLLLALQWGGAVYGWDNPRIIVLITISVVLIGAFGWRQHKRQDKAILPPRILKNRSILAGAWFSGCCNSTLSVVEYYLAIYFQAVRGYSATQSGLLTLPQVGGLCISCMLAGATTTMVGYYVPLMLVTSILAPVAAGLLTTARVDIKMVSLLCYEGLLGFGIGLGIQAPQLAAQTVLSPQDTSIGIGVVMFAQMMGPTIFISVAQAIFQRRLTVEFTEHASGANVTSLNNMGLSDIRNHIGKDRLRGILLGYDDAVTQTLYLPVALTCLTLLGSLGMEWRSVKKKQQ